MGREMLDPVLGIAILWVAWRALNRADLFRGVVLFITFGLLMALTWARLEAPDIALAEAAIGAGLSGALLLTAVSQLGFAEDHDEERDGRLGSMSAAAAAIAAVALVAATLAAAWHMEPARDVPALVERHLAGSGATNPVTSVLLNFRAYDTWLEVVVLLIAAVALQALRQEGEPAFSRQPAVGAPMLPGVVRLLLPLLVLTGGYLFWRGTHGPGGAFQAGAVLGSAAALVILAGGRVLAGVRGVIVRGAVAAGAFAFLLTALHATLSGRHFLQLPVGAAELTILLVEGAVTVSIALALTALFAGNTAALGSRAAGATEGPDR